MFYTPNHPLLKKCIQCIWIIKHESMPLHLKMLPDGHCDIMINLGEPYGIAYNREAYQWVSGSMLFGQRSKSLHLNQKGQVNMIGIRLNPGKEYALTGRSADTFVNGHLPLTELFGETMINEEEKLRSAEDNRELLVSHTEDLLLKIIKHPEQLVNEKMELAMDRIFQHQVKNAYDLMNELNLTYKQGERLFKKHLGLTPKMYLRVVRFHRAFRMLRGKKTVDWTMILRDLNYYDQSHFIKDYHYFTGNAPSVQFNKRNTLDEFLGFR